MKNYQSRSAKIFKKSKLAEEQTQQRIQNELSKVNQSLKEIDSIKSALTIPTQLHIYTEIDHDLMVRAMAGDPAAINRIADQYKRQCHPSKNKSQNDCWLQWFARLNASFPDCLIIKTDNEKILSLIPADKRDMLVKIGLEKYKDKIAASLMSMAKTKGFPFNITDIEVEVNF